VSLDSTADTIELTHTARTRGGFAVGAVMAAEWLGRRKGIFAVDAFVDEILKA
jgi:4-hydroxy-tetrahydrodipicolinate reductase